MNCIHIHIPGFNPAENFFGKFIIVAVKTVPKLFPLGKILRVVGKLDILVASFPLVESYKRGESEHKAFGKLALDFNVIEKGGQKPCFELSRRVKRNGHKLVSYEGVLIPFYYAVGECRHLVLRKVDCGVDLFEYELSYELAYYRVVHRLPDGVYAAQIGDGHHCRMTAVENFNLSLFIRLDIVCENNVETRAVRRQNFLDVRFLFQYPKVENFALYDVVVDIARFFLNFFYFVSGIAGNDTVYKRGSEMVAVLHPIDKLPVHFIYFSKFGETAVKLVAVVVYKFAGDYSKSFVFCALEFIVTPF